MKQPKAKIIYNGPVPHDEESDSAECDYNIIVYTIGNEYFRARSYELNLSNEEIDILSLQGARIPMKHIRPRFPKSFTVGPKPLSDDIFVKTPQLATYDSSSASTPADSLLEEAGILEYLMHFPHPNIATYHDCVLKGNRISGLCMTRYTMTLRERMLLSDKGTLPLPTSREIEAWYNDIKNGLDHLHSLGYVHQDLDPRNVMLDSDNRAIIIDFDSCQLEGEPLGPKSHGTSPWIDEQNERGEVSDRNYDFEGLRVIRRFLEKARVVGDLSTADDADDEASEGEDSSDASQAEEDYVLASKVVGKRKSCSDEAPKEGMRVTALDSHRAKRQKVNRA